MIYRWFVRRMARDAWNRLSEHDLDALRIADDIHFTYAGDHSLATEVRSADELRTWLTELFRRLPRLRFEIEDMIVEGSPRTTRMMTRYTATQDGKPVYVGISVARLRWGRLVEEYVLPDTQAAAAITEAPGTNS
jgi:ketosteroid isomerase-like protein